MLFNTEHIISLPFYILVMVILLGICIKQNYQLDYVETLNATAKVIVLYIAPLVLGSFLKRIVAFVTELLYINTSSYNGSIFKLLNNTMSMNIPSIIIIISTIFLYVIFGIRSNEPNSKSLVYLCAGAFSVLFLDIFNFHESKANTTKSLMSKDGLDYASAMAFSYFFGYLKIILPASGGKERLGIKVALDIYEYAENVTVPVKKLFILIPSSAYIPPDLAEVSNNWMESTKNLEEIDLDRAGVKNRKYDNTIYKIHQGGKNKFLSKPMYVAVEGASPLLTLYEVQKSVHKFSDVYRENSHEIVKSFYLTLQDLLNEHLDCRDLCELVYYDDYEPDGVTRVNPAVILLDRIRQYISASNKTD